jgi:acyl-CoA synthetase (AMP-forming)/AMP-acid ligase II
MAYYWNNVQATEQAFRNGWLHTGDVGYMDSDGFFYLVDRKNDMLISGGYNVYPREVEEVLLACEGVVEAAVVGLPDEKWGDRIHAVVSGRPGLDPEQILAQAREKLASYKRPKGVEIWPELPKSSANKILRRSVREALVARIQEREASK